MIKPEIPVFDSLREAKAQGYELQLRMPILVWRKVASGWLMGLVKPNVER